MQCQMPQMRHCMSRSRSVMGTAGQRRSEVRRCCRMVCTMDTRFTALPQGAWCHHAAVNELIVRCCVGPGDGALESLALVPARPDAHPDIHANTSATQTVPPSLTRRLSALEMDAEAAKVQVRWLVGGFSVHARCCRPFVYMGLVFAYVAVLTSGRTACGGGEGGAAVSQTPSTGSSPLHIRSGGATETCVRSTRFSHC